MQRTVLLAGFFFAIVALIGLQESTAQKSQQPIAMVIVTAPSVEIKAVDKAANNGVPRVIGTAQQNARLWVLDGNDQQTLVIDATSSQPGWVSASAVRVVTASPNDSAIAQTQYNQAIANAQSGDFQQARLQLDQAVAAVERSFGPEYPFISVLLRTTAEMHNQLREFDQAEACLNKALALNRKHAGAGHSTTIDCLSAFAECYQIQGRFDKARAVYQQALKDSTDAVGRQHLQTAGLLVQLANLNSDNYQYAEAEENYTEAWTIRKQILGEDHESTQSAAGGLGQVYFSIGQPAKAAETLEKSLSILEKQYGTSHPSLSFSLTYLGFAYQALANYQRAEECLDRIYQIDVNTKGAESKEALNSLHNLATLAQLNDQNAKAEQLFLQCLRGRVKVLGEEHHQTLATIWALGNLYLERGDDNKAEAYLVRTLRLAEETGDTHRDSPYHLGKLYSNKGQYDMAQALIQNAIDLEASRNRESDGHMLTSLSEVQVRMGQLQNAVATQDLARRRVSAHIKHTLSGMPKAARELFLARAFASDMHTALSLALKRADDPKTAALSAGWLLNGKVIGQEVIAEASLLAAPESAPLVAELGSVRDQIAGIVVQTNMDDPQTKKRLAELQARQQRLELKVGELGTGRFAKHGWRTIDQVRSQLADQSRFISVAKVRMRDFSKSQEKTKWMETRYVAWIVPPVGGGDVQLIDLGDAKSIDANVEQLRKEVTGDFFDRLKSDGELATEKQYRKIAESLSAKILQPLEKHLTGVQEIIISPDGELWRVPWEALILANDDYLIESYSLRYVMSGRDLVPTPTEKISTSEPVIFASPNYDLEPTGVLSKETSNRQRLATPRMYFPPLAGTAKEAASIQPSIEKYVGQPSRMLLENEAQESTFKELKRPRVLVLSTHGYYQPSPGGETNAARKPQIAPLLRCGLALAGSNNPFPNDQVTDDGILTGLEIVGTDLHGTELVVLSACETGLGEVHDGEGVAGLRQAFQLAGAQSVVSSLWQVSDQETVALMTLFFQNISAGQNKPTALRTAQLARIDARRKRHQAAHPFYWAAFTLTGQE